MVLANNPTAQGEKAYAVALTYRCRSCNPSPRRTPYRLIWDCPCSEHGLSTLTPYPIPFRYFSLRQVRNIYTQQPIHKDEGLKNSLPKILTANRELARDPRGRYAMWYEPSVYDCHSVTVEPFISSHVSRYILKISKLSMAQ